MTNILQAIKQTKKKIIQAGKNIKFTHAATCFVL